MKSKLIYGCVTLLILSSCQLWYMHFKERKKTGYVTTLKVFEEFLLKKELENDYKKIQVAKQSCLDSIKLRIQTLSQNLGTKTPNREESIEISKRAYLLKEKQFNEENDQLYQQYNEQIWKQLNQFIEDFGKENNYDYLFGASGQGNIMYARETEDLTKQITDYVNTKYLGKKNK